MTDSATRRRPLAAGIAFLAGLLVLAAIGASGAHARIAYYAGGSFAAPFDTATDETVPSMSLNTGTTLTGVSMSHDGTRAFVVGENNQLPPVSTITTVNTSTFAGVFGSPLSLTTGEWDGIATQPGSSTVYFFNSVGYVFPFDPATNTADYLDARLSATAPASLAINPAGTMAYVGSLAGKGNIAVVDLLTPDPVDGYLKTITTNPSEPSLANKMTALSFTPDGKTLYAAVSSHGRVDAIDIATDQVTPINVGNVAATHGAIAMSPDGSKLWVANPVAGTVIPIDVATNTAGAAIPVGTQAQMLAVTPDSKTVYVGFAGAQMVKIDVASGTAGSPFTSGWMRDEQQQMAFAPNQGPTAAFTAIGGEANAASSFDASTSSDPDGTVTRFDWDFGDGTVLKNGGPKPTHVYRSAGAHTVNLTVTDNEGCSSSFVYTGQSASCNGGVAALTSSSVVVSADKTTPRVDLVVKSPRKLSKTVRLAVACPDEACSIAITPSVLAGRKYKIKTISKSLAPASSALISVRLSNASRAAAKRKLAKRKKVYLNLKLVARDEAGNQTLISRKVRLK